MRDHKSLHDSFCATLLLMGCNIWGVHRKLTHYTTLTSLFGSVSTLLLNKMPFSFSFSTLRLDFIFLCRLAFEIVTSVHPSGTHDVFFFFQTFLFYTWYPQTNRQMILNGGAEESALLAACIRQDHCGLSGGKSNLVTFLRTVKIHWSLFYSTETLKVIFMTWYELWIKTKSWVA